MRLGVRPGTPAMRAMFHQVMRLSTKGIPMRLWFFAALSVIGLTAGCGSPPPETTIVAAPSSPAVVLPPEATIVCPSGRAAILSGGVYRC